MPDCSRYGLIGICLSDDDNLSYSSAITFANQVVGMYWLVDIFAVDGFPVSGSVTLVYLLS